MNTADAELSALLTLAITAPFLAQARHQLEPHAAAVAASFACYILRHLRPDDARLAVFLTAAWPGIGAWLVVQVLRDEGPEAEAPSPLPRASHPGAPSIPRGRLRRAFREGGFSVGSTALPTTPGYPGSLLLSPQDSARRSSGSTIVVLLFLAYAGALTRWGSFFTPCWPWPILLPQLVGAVIAALCWAWRRDRRPARWVRAWAVAGALILPASTMADLVTVWAGAPDEVRAAIGAVTWGLLGTMLVAAQARRR